MRSILISQHLPLKSLNADAIVPLLFSTSAFGLHYPILNRLTEAIRVFLKNSQPSHEMKAASEAQRFYSLLERVIHDRSKPFLHPLFPVDQEGRHSNDSEACQSDGEASAEKQLTFHDGDGSSTSRGFDLESLVMVFHLAGDQVVALENTLRRLQEVFRVGSSQSIFSGDRAERGPRDL